MSMEPCVQWYWNEIKNSEKDYVAPGKAYVSQEYLKRVQSYWAETISILKFTKQHNPVE